MFLRELLDRQPPHRRLLEHRGLDAVDRDLGPDQQAEPVGQLVRVRVQRVVRAQDGRAELLGVVDQLVAAGVVDREALGLGVLVQADAADVEVLAVEDQAAVGDLDRADPAVQRVARDLLAADADGEADVVEVRVLRRPQARLVDAQRVGERRDPVRADALGAEVRACWLPYLPVIVARCPSRVTFLRLILASTLAGQVRAVDHRADLDLLEVDRVELAQVDLALDAGVVPPAAGRDAVGVQAGGREVGDLAARVHAHHEPVRARCA